MDRELGTDRRDVPHEFVQDEDSQDCAMCEKSYSDARHTEWAQQAERSREVANLVNQSSIRVFG